MEKVLKRFFALCLSLTVMAAFTGCDSAEERLQTEANKKQAAKNAKAYILDKYNINAKVVYAKEDRANDMFRTKPLSDIFVVMEYDDKTFTVLINGADENTDGADNYQQNEIMEAFRQELQEFIPGEPYALTLYSGSGEDTYYVGSDKLDVDNLHSVYFDGTNLEEVLAETAAYSGRCSCVAEYVGDANLSDVSLTAFAERYNVTIAALSYLNEESYEKASTHSYNIRGSYEESYFCENAMYLYDALYTNGYEETHLTFDFGKIGDFYYMIPNQPADSVTIRQLEQPLDASGWNGRGALHAAAYSDAYEVLQGDGVLYLYYPKDADDGKIMLGEVTDGAYEAVSNPHTVGDYYVDWLYLREDRNQTKQFMMIYENE